jgi:class 3 adenylate cyclase
MAGASLRDISPAQATRLTGAFSAQVKALNLVELKVYDLNRRVLFATNRDEIGSVENGSALRAVIATTDPEIVTKTVLDGSQQYEFYVPVLGADGSVRTVFELYEPVDYLDQILLKSATPIIAVPGLFFLAVAFALNSLVVRAQGDIDQRTQAINALRRRLESFVSTTAADAAKQAQTGSDIASARLTTTLFYSDIRDFTGFSEQNTPEAVVRFLNKIMTLQVDILKHHGGDIDKMIGDAVLARFDDDEDGSKAVAAARAIIEALHKGPHERGLGIGLSRGEVISGAIGPANRRDYTVIGDAVNVAARLCTAASAGEIVVEAGLADDSFQATEHVTVKGRKGPVAIRRLRLH